MQDVRTLFLSAIVIKHTHTLFSVKHPKPKGKKRTVRVRPHSKLDPVKIKLSYKNINSS